MSHLTGQVLTQAEIDSWFVSGTYTPTLGAMAIGTGGTPTNTAKFTFAGFPAGGVLTVEGKIKFGTTAPTLPGASEETISLPSGYSQIDTNFGLALLTSAVSYYDITAGLMIQGGVYPATATTVGLRLFVVNATFLQVNTSPTATTPFTWAVNDEIHYRFSARCTGP